MRGHLKQIAEGLFPSAATPSLKGTGFSTERVLIERRREEEKTVCDRRIGDKLVLLVTTATLLLSGCFIGIPSAYALDTPTPAPADARVRFVNYRPYDVTKVVGTLLSSLQLEFAADEEIANVVVGNTVAWEVAPAGNILFLKPREKHPLTNLQVVTTRRDGSRRSYQLELTIRAGSVDLASGTYFLVKYRYPEDEANSRREKLAAKAAARAAGNEAKFVESTFEMYEDYGPRNWHYSAQGARAIEPSSVYDNGKTTTFTFSGVSEIPAIYLVNTDGSESLVPKSVEGQLVRVHALGRKFVLRRGKDVLCVFNDAFIASGHEPGTGTVSPSIDRVVKGSVR